MTNLFCRPEIRQPGVRSHFVCTNDENDEMLELEEDELFNRERKAFLNLAKTQPTLQRISSLIEKGISIRN